MSRVSFIRSLTWVSYSIAFLSGACLSGVIVYAVTVQRVPCIASAAAVKSPRNCLRDLASLSDGQLTDASLGQLIITFSASGNIANLAASRSQDSELQQLFERTASLSGTTISALETYSQKRSTTSVGDGFGSY